MSVKSNGLVLKEENRASTASMLSYTLGVLHSIISAVRGFCFALYYPTFINLFYNDKVVPFREKIFKDMQTVVPQDKQDGRLRILEIGCGPGCNFEYLPKPCRYTAVDKNNHFKSVLLTNLKKHPGIELEQFVNAGGEDMRSIPSNSFDVVVTSHIHCSVDSSQQVLSEIKRVLIPGGRYYFFEHVYDEQDTLRYKWQVFFNKIGLWKIAGNGCTFVNLEKELREANFLTYHGNRYVFQNNSWSYYLVYLVASHFGGYAEKGK